MHLVSTRRRLGWVTERRGARRVGGGRASRLPLLERLEERALLAISLPTLSATAWTSIGPAPIEPSATSGDSGPDSDAINNGLGPNPIGIFNPVAGRIDSIAASPTDPNTIYVAAAGGGVWKTTDGGTNWTPLTDGQATLSMGKLAIARSNPNVIYAGTGDSEANLDGGGNLDSRMTPGRGILKSTDGGQSWTLLGASLFDRREIGAVVIDPTDANTVYVAVADFVPGSIAGNTGIWKSTDGGQTWTDTTSSATANIAPADSFLSLVMDPTNPQVLYASASDIGGNPSNGVYKTTDSGVHWAAAGNFPIGGSQGRIALAISPANPQVVYAAVVDNSTGLVSFEQTTDAGAHWTVLGGIPSIIDPANSQAFYDTNIAVDPTDPTGNTFYASGQAGADSILRVVVTPGSPPTTSVLDISGGTNAPHPDHHALAFDASNRLLDGNDGGIWRLDSFNPAVSWTDMNGDLGITQFIGIAVDPTSSLVAMGGSQDNGTERYTGAPAWSALLGGDGGYTRIDQSNPATLYHEFFGISLERSDNSGATWTGISPPGAAGGLFYVPYVLDPSNSKRMIYGTATLYQTNDATATPPVWTAIGTPGTNGFNPGGDAISAEAIAPTAPNTIYITTENHVFVTTNDGATWTDVSIPGVSTGLEDVQVDPFNSQIAYVSRDQYGGGKLFRTNDGGATWTDITGNLPDEPAHTLAIDPRTSPETLYLGNNIGVYVSYNQGVSWVRFGSAMPNVQVKQLQLQLNGGVNVLAAGTYGRGLFEVQSDPPLSVTALAPTGLVEGKPFGPVEVATFTDPNPGAHPVGEYSATIDWGDGTPATAGQILEDANGVFHVSGSHTYAEDGAPIITIMVSSTGGSSGGASTNPLTVIDAPLAGTAAPIAATEGAAIPLTTLLATFTDTDPFAAAADYSATVNWGDGSPVEAATITAPAGPGLPFNVSQGAGLGHTYKEEGEHTVTVTINDAGGAKTVTVGSAHVADAALTFALIPVASATEATPFSGAVAAFSDDNPNAPANDFKAVVDWGDGTPTSLGTVQATGPGSFDVLGTHTYADSGVNGGSGPFHITIHVLDKGGAGLVLGNTVNVADRVLTVNGFLSQSSDSGESHTDGITNVATPRFFGVASEAGATVTLYAQATGGGPLTVIGTGTADASRAWKITSQHLADGSYKIFVRARDAAGKTISALTPVMPNTTQGPLVIDTVGPKITNVQFQRLKGQVVLTIQDERSGLNMTTLVDAANYAFNKIHTKPAGTYLVNVLAPTPQGPLPTDPVVVTATINQGHAIHGGFYLFTAKSTSALQTSGIQDVAGNALDGEFYGFFPSGNKVRGGDFLAELDAIHNKIFPARTIIGQATPVVPPGTPATGFFLNNGQPFVPANPQRLHVQSVDAILAQLHATASSKPSAVAAGHSRAAVESALT